MLQALAVSSELLASLEKGVRTYVTVGHKQACKQLGKFTLLIARCSTRHWLVCRAALANAIRLDAAPHKRLLQRSLQIQIEFERQFVLVINILMCARKLGGWKRLHKLPFEAVSRRSNDSLVHALLDLQTSSRVDEAVVLQQLRSLLQRVLDTQECEADLRFCFCTFANVLIARAARCQACNNQSAASVLDSHLQAAELQQCDSLVQCVGVSLLQVTFELAKCVSQTQANALGTALVHAFGALASRYPQLLSAAFSRLVTIVSQIEPPDDSELADSFEHLSVDCASDSQRDLLLAFAREVPWKFWRVDMDELRCVEK